MPNKVEVRFRPKNRKKGGLSMTSDRSDKLGSGLSATQPAGGLKDPSGFSRRQFFKRSAMAGAATLSGGIFQALRATSCQTDIPSQRQWTEWPLSLLPMGISY